MTGIGWVQGEPRQKHHYMLKRSSGWYWTACGMWGTDDIGSLLIVVNPPRENMCKNCLNALQRSEKTGEST